MSHKVLHEIHVWLIYAGCYVLVKNIRRKNIVDVQDVTISTDSLEIAVNEIESLWGILCDKSALREVYNFSSSSKAVEGYFLNIALSFTSKSVVEERGGGHFINYRDFDDFLRRHNLSDDLKESYLRVIENILKSDSY